ncbi:pyruvate, phosphate dikinase [Vulcanibacillus modesticaldus]|uniref:Pyruvate, phosphate dikinase n=1 Tax=Vulcanibacillus modesticaldus TaxID=337097 RepID=A0A1D2YVT6_9BACI|nr:pyruvate, phosphate dikinase [Vulcanibacillus modesticaldus]OEF99735.1 pyruvate, phosphate dikinase [Vulcanibacillus modesticaldus]
MSKKYVYLFHEGSKEMREILGGKGANLAEMTRVGLPVPPGFTISTTACNDYYSNGKTLTESMITQVNQALDSLEKLTGKRLGDMDNPLLVSVRSGSVISMPGMMDTVLNLGLNDDTVKGLVELTQNPRFAYDSYRRFIQMFSDVVLGIEHYLFEQEIDHLKEKKGFSEDIELSADDWKKIVEKYKKIVLNKTKQPFPQDPKLQLEMAIRAVFDSWNNQRAIVYRKINKIPDHLGTAVNIQMMVFGNMGEDSGTGVAFTRNPSTGEASLYGEYLMNAQGEDVVAGIRTPKPINNLKEINPEVFKQFVEIAKQLEQHYKDMQDIEFTIEKGKLYLLQTRTGKRTAQAAVKIAVDLVHEGIIDKETAILRVDPEQLEQLLHRQIDTSATTKVIAKGLPASPGAATGKIVFDADKAEQQNLAGEQVILVRPETTPEDIHGINAAQGILTTRGGMTSHAAVVARGMGKACITGCESLKIDLKKEEIWINGEFTLKAGDVISIDGSTGKVMLGEVLLIDPELSDEFKELLTWADQIKKIEVRANADNPDDAKRSREFGAKGIGLCRTEHMFMDSKRIPIVQKMILAEDIEERREALAKLLPMQQSDFRGILKEMAGLPVTIRLLDPPLHEFLPNIEELLVDITRGMYEDKQENDLSEKEKLLRKVRNLSEFNPMLGHRGCRLGITFPEIYAMQAEAIFNATVELKRENIEVEPEIMIPLVGHVNELKLMKELIIRVADKVKAETNTNFDFTIGTMIEVPRAALTADEIAEHADFFSFGTNDLTQTTFGFSRDDAEGKFLQYYLDHKVLSDNPFVTLDQNGVGQLVKIGTKLGRNTKPDLKIGICGEHGGEKRSIEFVYKTGLNYVSCSPYRVPLARLAAAQATIKNNS